MIHPIVLIELLLLVSTANTAPLLMKWASRGRSFTPLDLGVRLGDGRPLFGPSKTWAGLLCALMASILMAEAIGLSTSAGIHAAIAAMLGDLLSSFVKRRLGMASSAPLPGLDQIPKAALPLLALRPFLAASWADLALALALFVAGEFAIAFLLAKAGYRDPPL